MIKISIYLLPLLLLSYLASSQTDIVPAGSMLKKLSSDQFKFLEGPVWYEDSVLLFTDLSVSPSKIYKYSPVSKAFAVFRNNSEKTNGLTCDKDGVLLGCEQNKQRVVSMDRNGNVLSVLADTYNGKTFNSPNDLIADSKGGVYFTDPVFGTAAIQDKEAVYYISPAGNVTRVISDLIKPNGVILSPDGSKLYVVDTNNKYLYAWDVASDGSVSGKSTPATLQTNSGSSSGADGLAVDTQGNIYVTSDKGVQVFSPSGTYLTTISIPEKPTNCDFGGAEMKTLYVTAGKNLYAIDLNYPGFVIQRNTVSGYGKTCAGKEDLHFHLYPVPAKDFINYQTNFNSDSKIEVWNTLGKRVKEVLQLDAEGSFSLTDLANGVYFARAISGDHHHVQMSFMFIVSR